MFIPDPDFIYPGSIFLSIPDLTTTKEERKKLVVLPFFCSHKFLKTENYFIFEQVYKNFFYPLTLFLPKIVNKLSQIPIGWRSRIPDLRSGIRKTYSGTWSQGSKRDQDHGSGSATLPTTVGTRVGIKKPTQKNPKKPT
jgi:hypothetical protein